GIRPAGPDERRGAEPERDAGRARAEAPLTRDPARPAKAPPVDGCQPCERADAEMREVRRLLADGGHLELVPQVERDGGAVEARTDVRRAGGSTDVQTREPLRQARRSHRDRGRPRPEA